MKPSALSTFVSGKTEIYPYGGRFVSHRGGDARDGSRPVIKRRISPGERNSEILHRQIPRKRAACTFAPRKFCERRAKISDGKVRPAFVQENEFGKRAFPQKKIGEPLLAAGANQEIHVGRAAARNFRKYFRKGFKRKFRGLVIAARRQIDGFARGIIYGQTKVKARATSC